MTKRIKLTIFISILVILLGLLCRPSFSIAHAYTDYNNYTYDSYRVDIVVKDDNSYDITETITMTYGPATYGRHQGWARAIPYRYPVKMYDDKGTEYTYQSNNQVTLVSATEYYSSYSESGNYIIEMKQDGVYVNGQTKTYVIKYNYAVGDDYIYFKDYFIFNIIGVDYPVDVNNVEFSITMPHQFDATKVNFYTGAYGETNKFTDYTVAGNVISSNAPFNLVKNTALTVNIDLPQGYYTDVHTNYQKWNTILPIIAGVTLVIVAVLLILLKNRDHPTQVVEFYAPEGLSPAECKYILCGRASGLDVSSVIVLWANQGLVKIVLDDDKKPKQIARIKDMPDSFTADDKTVWQAMFGSSDIIDIGFNEKTSTAMSATASAIKARYNEANGSRYDKKYKNILWAITILGLMPLISFAIIKSMYHSASNMLGVIVTTIIALAFAIGILSVISLEYNKKVKALLLAIFSAISVLLVLIFNSGFTFSILDPTRLRIWYPILYFAVLLVLGSNFMKYNTKVYNLYGRVAGFKNAIEKADAPQLKALVKKDPEYFYKVIPYAHVFGIYTKFVDKFSGLAMPINDDIGDPLLTALILSDLRYNTRVNVMKKMRSSGSSFGGHGFGGGGFSGGGHGGGGGRGL